MTKVDSLVPKVLVASIQLCVNKLTQWPATMQWCTCSKNISGDKKLAKFG